ncbi:hypothetical protein BX600DRAFT_429326 [Xylariales sp. PMI_506]|nr:hypothetical protein BX600DRAFT_429326 [Xylariales sp. PMI_506]
MLIPTLLSTVMLSLVGNVVSQSSTCPFNYPPIINTTTSTSGLVFSIISSDPATNNRAVQLRPNPFLIGAFFAGVDDSSAVLLGNLQDGGVYAQARNEFNQLYGLGPTAYLNERDVVGNTTVYTVGFANSTQWPGAVDQGWTLDAPDEEGTYGLYHQTPEEVVNGFLLCTADIDLDNGAWYQLFYQNYQTAPADIEGCEDVGVRTTVAPTIFNGECDIGGLAA